jgi:tRNA(Ile)-lysidine synthase
MELLDAFRRHLATLALPPGRALVAVSGGPDSVTLLDLLRRASDVHSLTLIAAHFDHGIHPASGQVARGVEDLARSMGVGFACGRGQLGPGTGETAARAARYAWLETVRVREGAGLILTAHHADDQAETVLMRLLAGSGPAGLAGMAAREGPLVRPLLPFRRVDLLRHLRAAGLAAWLDPANQDPRHLRSWLRTEVLPALRHRLPDVDARLLRAGRQAGRARAAWSALLERLPDLDFRVEHDGVSVAGPALSGYDSALGEMVLGAAARRAGCPFGPTRAARVLALAARGASGSRVPLGNGWSAEVAFGRLRLARGSSPPAPDAALILAGSQGQVEWGRWRITWRCEPAPLAQDRGGWSIWVAPAGPLTVRHWHAGERLRPLGGPGRRLLVRCFQDARVPRSRREGWPVLAEADGVIWIPGVCRSDALLPEPGTEALRVDAEHA